MNCTQQFVTIRNLDSDYAHRIRSRPLPQLMWRVETSYCEHTFKEIFHKNVGCTYQRNNDHAKVAVEHQTCTVWIPLVCPAPYPPNVVASIESVQAASPPGGCELSSLQTCKQHRALMYSWRQVPGNASSIWWHSYFCIKAKQHSGSCLLDTQGACLTHIIHCSQSKQNPNLLVITVCCNSCHCHVDLKFTTGNAVNKLI